ncbi:hypothetical protein NMY22_g909 [Coprinellus aureogranulatus]|nr:hypothetical protein NMY22_g909 [Coprinellus aureogranulatus]
MMQPNPARARRVQTAPNLDLLSTMAGGSAGPGFHPHLPPARYTFMAKALGASMWFFIFYRMRQDGGKLIGKHPWATTTMANTIKIAGTRHIM